MSQLPVFENFHITDVFATTSYLENAGGGCTRIYNCVSKNGVLVPVGNSIVFPTINLLKVSGNAHTFARKLALIEMDGRPVH